MLFVVSSCGVRGLFCGVFFSVMETNKHLNLGLEFQISLFRCQRVPFRVKFRL